MTPPWPKSPPNPDARSSAGSTVAPYRSKRNGPRSPSGAPTSCRLRVCRARCPAHAPITSITRTQPSTEDARPNAGRAASSRAAGEPTGSRRSQSAFRIGFTLAPPLWTCPSLIGIQSPAPTAPQTASRDWASASRSAGILPARRRRGSMPRRRRPRRRPKHRDSRDSRTPYPRLRRSLPMRPTTFAASRYGKRRTPAESVSMPATPQLDKESAAPNLSAPCFAVCHSNKGLSIVAKNVTLGHLTPLLLLGAQRRAIWRKPTWHCLAPIYSMS